MNTKCNCCKILKWNVHFPNNGDGGGDIAPGCCGCCSEPYIMEIAAEPVNVLAKRSVVGFVD